jgi:hypothetical protein
MLRTLIILFVFIEISLISNAQLEPIGWEKLCLGDGVNSVMDMKYKNNLLFVKLDYGKELVALNTETNEIEWGMKYPKMYYVGYGLHSYGENIMFYSSDNKMDSKNKVIQLTWIMTLNSKDGSKLDSVKCNFSIVSLTDSPGKSGIIGMIKMGSDNKYSATIFNKNKAEIKYDLLTENSKIGGNPNTIRIDPSEKYAAVGTANGKQGFYLFDLSSGKKLINLTGEGDIQNIEFSSDSKFCFYVQKKKLVVVNLETLKLEKQLDLPVNSVFVSLHSDNENIAITGFGTKAQVVFLNWKTGKIVKSDLATAGGKSEFNDKGELYVCQATNALDCKVSKTDLPYLAKFTFKNSTVSNNSSSTYIASTTLSSTSTFKAGSRAFIYYSGDKRYYSGTIYEETTTGYAVVYDDASRASVLKNEVKALPELMVGQKIQAFRSDLKYYNATITEIKVNLIKVKFSNTSEEWIPLRNIMQVE